MARFLKTFTDDRLRRKIVVVRGFCLVLLASWLGLLLWVGASGRFDVTFSRTGGRYSSPSIARTITWADSPNMFVFQLAWHFLIGAAFIAALYVVLARVIERFHGRTHPIFRRKYPY